MFHIKAAHSEDPIVRSGAAGEAHMKLTIALSAFLMTGFMAATTQDASAVVYCNYVGYPKGCIARAGVVLRARPVVRAVTPGVGAPVSGFAGEPR